MRGKLLMVTVFIFAILILVSSCRTAKNYSTQYYFQHEQVLNNIEASYSAINKKTPFSIAFNNKAFTILTLEIKTDSITYRYEFDASEQRLTDSLLKYNLDAANIKQLIASMQSIRCIWINNLDYYVDDKKKSLVFISIKTSASRSLFGYKKYYILSYFPQPQYFDDQGRLMLRRKRKEIHIINGDIFRRINDKICYTISEQYR